MIARRATRAAGAVGIVSGKKRLTLHICSPMVSTTMRRAISSWPSGSFRK